ncbi:MAG: signal recognition particle-docking protein FtsY [Erysipelotrichaceae bacterium]|nr:signal recognition particle-docking protein FtsY [Erysipelotrichaceae bacterium]
MGLFAYLKNKFSGKKENPKAVETTEKYQKGLAKSRAAFWDRLEDLSKRYAMVDASYFDELEQILIEADVGVEWTMDLLQKLMEKAKEEGLTDPKKVNEELVDLMFVDYVESGDSVVNDLSFTPGKTTVLLMEGVNGVGKTTTIAKLAHRYQQQGKRVLLAAADTFRAGAVEQLKIWADRLHCPIVTGPSNGDPASVCFDAARYAKEHQIDLLIVDTAGRLQNKKNLMDELSKMQRVLGKEIEGAPQEVFLVIDATTGQNGIVQAKAFQDVFRLTGIVVTKMDGTSKGGIIFAIRSELGVPVRFIGLGEKMDDLQEFDLDEYLHALLLGGEKSDA